MGRLLESPPYKHFDYQNVYKERTVPIREYNVHFNRKDNNMVHEVMKKEEFSEEKLKELDKAVRVPTDPFRWTKESLDRVMRNLVVHSEAST